MGNAFKLRVWLVFSAILVVGGAVLGFTASPWFLLAVPAGVFGPGAARRLGWLRDADEFLLSAQDSAAWAGLAAASAAGFFCIVLERASPEASRLAASDALLVTLTTGLVIYAACYLFRFWNGKKAGRIILLCMAAGWLAFTLCSEWGHPMAMLLENAAVTAPLLLLVLLSRFFPRISGLVCLAAAIASAWAFGTLDFSGKPNLFVFTALSLPLMAAGIGMFVKEGRKTGAKEEK